MQILLYIYLCRYCFTVRTTRRWWFNAVWRSRRDTRRSLRSPWRKYVEQDSRLATCVVLAAHGTAKMCGYKGFSFKLPEHSSSLNDTNFLTRMLYKNINRFDDVCWHLPLYFILLVWLRFVNHLLNYYLLTYLLSFTCVFSVPAVQILLQVRAGFRGRGPGPQASHQQRAFSF